MKAYRKLRLKCVENEVNIFDLSEILNKSHTYISSRITAKQDRFWSEDDMYKLMEYFAIPSSEMADYFSKEQRKGV